MTEEVPCGATKAAIVSLCSTYLGGQWKYARDDEITVYQLTVGCANQNFRCVHRSNKPIDSAPSDVVLHIYTRDLLGSDKASIRCRPVQSMVESVLSRNGIGPKLICVLPHGRIEEYVPGMAPNVESGKNPDVFLKISQTLARLHSLKIPISRSVNPITRHRVHLSQSHDSEECSTMSTKIRLSKEFDWYDEIIRKVSGRPVFVHGDFHCDNMLVVNSKHGSNKEVMFLDFEASGYFFRSYDIAFLFRLANLRPERVGSKIQLRCTGSEPTNEAQVQFVKTYLEEWKNLQNGKLCPVHDTIDHLMLEVQISVAFIEVLLMTWMFHAFALKDNARSEENGKTLLNYEMKKKKSIEACKRLGHFTEQKCCCLP